MNTLTKISCLGLIGLGLAAGQALALTQVNSPVMVNRPGLVIQPKFACTLIKTNRGPLFQKGKLTLQQVSGTPISLLQNRRVDIFLTSSKTRLLTSVCTTGFRQGHLRLKSIMLIPQINETSGVICKARLTNRPCTFIGVPR